MSVLRSSGSSVSCVQDQGSRPAVCSNLTDHTRAAFSAWLHLRHHERGQHSDLTDLTSVGVLLTPRTDGYREWDTSVVAVNDDPELTDEELHTYQGLFNTRNSRHEGVPEGCV